MAKVENPARWIQLLNPNHWLYFITPRTTINVICDNTVTQTGGGIVQLNEDCTIREEFVTIQAHKLFPGTFNTSFVWTKNAMDTLHRSNITNAVYQPGPQEAFSKNLQELKERIANLQSNAKLPHPLLHPVDIHQFIISYLGLFLVGILMAFLLVTRWVTTKPPVPHPRTLPAEAFRLYRPEDSELI